MILAIAIIFALQCASGAIILDCTYSMQNWPVVGNLYTCNPRVFQLNQTRNVEGVSQNHQSGKSNKDVKALRIENQPIYFIPEDINLFFANLEVLDISSCPIKSVTKEDLKPFPKLRSFGFKICELTTINGDVFIYSPELQYVNFSSNKITNVGPGIFQHSPNLTYALFNGNLCITSSASNSAAAVASIARELAFKCPPTVGMTEKLILEGENFQEAVNEQIEPEITVIDGRVEQLEQKVNQTDERFEKLIFNLCKTHAICS